MFELDPETIEYPEYRKHIVGIVERFGQAPVLCYDRTAVLAQLAEDMGEDDALEFFEFNTIGAYVGPFTPCFITFDRDLAVEFGGTASGVAGSGTDSESVSERPPGSDSESGAAEAGDGVRT